MKARHIFSKTKSLRSAHQALIAKNVLGLKSFNDDTELELKDALIFWVADILAYQHVFPIDTQLVILDTYLSEPLIDLATMLNDAEVKKMAPTIWLSFLDDKYVAISGKNNFFDTTTLKRIETLPVIPFENRSYNITRLYFDNSRFIQRVIKDAANNERSDENTESVNSA